MYLLYRAAFTLYDFRGDNPRKRKDELLCTLNREYAAGDIVQIQYFRRDLIPFLNRWPILQTTDLYTSNKIPFPRSTGKRFLATEIPCHIGRLRNAFFLSPRCWFHCSTRVTWPPPQHSVTELHFDAE